MTGLSSCLFYITLKIQGFKTLNQLNKQRMLSTRAGVRRVTRYGHECLHVFLNFVVYLIVNYYLRPK